MSTSRVPTYVNEQLNTCTWSSGWWVFKQVPIYSDGTWQLHTLSSSPAPPVCAALVRAAKLPHQQLPVWSRTGRKSVPVLYGSRWPKRSDDPWNRAREEESRWNLAATLRCSRGQSWELHQIWLKAHRSVHLGTVILGNWNPGWHKAGWVQFSSLLLGLVTTAASDFCSWLTVVEPEYLTELLLCFSSMNKQMFLIKCVLPVRHAHDDVIHSAPRWFIDDGFQSRDQRLTSLQTKTFLCRPLLLEELLKPEHTHINSAHTLHPPHQCPKVIWSDGVLTGWSGPFGPAESSSPPD